MSIQSQNMEHCETKSERDRPEERPPNDIVWANPSAYGRRPSDSNLSIWDVRNVMDLPMGEGSNWMRQSSSSTTEYNDDPLPIPPPMMMRRSHTIRYWTDPESPNYGMPFIMRQRRLVWLNPEVYGSLPKSSMGEGPVSLARAPAQPASDQDEEEEEIF
jgi:hypothetical protein